MYLIRQSTGQRIILGSSSALGVGGEARIVAVPQDAGLVAKLYHYPTEQHARKLAAMLASPPQDPMAAQGKISIAWPVDLLLADEGGPPRVVGFVMPRVRDMRPIIDFYHPKTRRQQCPLFNYRYLHYAGRNLAAAMAALHARGYVVGDVNESNVLVAETSLITLVDTDSFQVRDAQTGAVYRCPVGKPEFTPPELQGRRFADVDRAPEHDLFGLAVLLFQLLMEGTHPFAGRLRGAGDPPPYEMRISSGHFPHAAGRRVPYDPMPSAPPFEILAPPLQQLFRRCFEDGHAAPPARPDARTWRTALDEAAHALVNCRTNDQHWYGGHLGACPWCRRTALLKGRDPFPDRRGGATPATGTPPQPPAPARRPTVATPPRPAHVPFLRRLSRRARVLLGSGGLAILLFTVLLAWRRPTADNPPSPSPQDTTATATTPEPPKGGTTNLPVEMNSIGMALVQIPAGEFLMGSPDSEKERGRDESQHRVRITKPFWLGMYEVTQGEYQKVMGENPSWFSTKGGGASKVAGQDTDRLPIEQVSWEDATKFCERLSALPEEEKAGRVYRLPTEAEWEYACRAGSTTRYCFDESRESLDDYAWYASNSGSRTHPVGQKRPNAWGLHDMHGNVWEWVADWYGPYPTGVATDPEGPGPSAYRVDRGGSWYLVAGFCRSVYRDLYSPGYRDRDLGFRLAAVRSGR